MTRKMLELKRWKVQQALRPLLVLEIDNKGASVDVTHRFLGSMLGESLFLDTNKSYAILHCSIGGLDYEWNLIYKNDLEVHEAKKKLGDFHYRVFHNLFYSSNLDHWSTNIGGKSNFTVSACRLSRWGKVFTDLSTIVITSNSDELYANCPWLGTENTSFLAKVWLEKVLKSGVYLRVTRARWSCEEWAGAHTVLKDDWYAESPPIVMPFSALTDLLVSYLPIKNQGHKNYWTIYSNKRELTFAETLCGLFAITNLLEQCLKGRLLSGDVWRWLADWTQFHPNFHTVENYRRDLLDSTNFYGKDMPARSIKMHGEVQPHVILKAYKNIMTQKSQVSSLVEPLRLKITNLVEMVYLRDRTLNAPRKALKESLIKVAKSQVRWKGNTKAGERILRETLIDFEKEVVNSPKNYKDLVSGRVPTMLFVSKWKRFSPSYELVDRHISKCSDRESNFGRLGSTVAYRFKLYLCYLIKISKKSKEEVKVPPTLELVLEKHNRLSHDCMLNRCEDNLVAGSEEEALSFLEMMVKDYSNLERKALKCGAGSSNTWESPLLLESNSEKGEHSSYPVNIFEASSPAEYIYKKLLSLKKRFPERVSQLAACMMQEMTNLNDAEEEESEARDMYKDRVLRHIANPEVWKKLV